MAEEQNNIKAISKSNSGFPDYLDFDKLRTEGIEYLGKLSGKIWTDHNVHDPGITILEVLCYALLDLGYRTNLPAKDILAQDPEGNAIENNFLTPSAILTCNPLTITDFRKLLIDIDGVKNAWLQVATEFDPDQFCMDGNDPSFVHVTRQKDPCCLTFLNGLYHVFLDLEKNIDKDFESSDEKDKYVKNVTYKVKKALMSHRNMGEDFIDITILCKWEIGVCAEIELETFADPEKVYLEMMGKLRDFFSPAPRFYTLSQLLDKDKSIDDVFAGRPYDITESHGFVDADELESLKLRKTIHVSDVYNVLFTIPGIRKVKRLRLRSCESQSLKEDKWVVAIPLNHIPDFSSSCSGFEFVRDSIPIAFNFKKYESILQLNFENNGKILYQKPSDKLDTEIPKGTYHKDLSNWDSIQNEFPRVYGIAEGGLPGDASPLRKAQALQLKGYLLFFDQLLANYLSQLKNLRSLFALTPRDGLNYFSTEKYNVPDLHQLVRYKGQGPDSSPMGKGSTLAFPASKKVIQTLGSEIKNIEIEEHRQGIRISSYPFPNAAERDVAINQLTEDFYNNEYSVEVITRSDECVFFFVIGSSNDIVLISSRYYSSEREARAAAALLGCAAATAENYQSFMDQGCFYFDIRLKSSDFSRQLELIAENGSGSGERREEFLQHLMSRFAETFTDYALLSFGFNSKKEIQIKEIRAKEVFLSNYGALSSNRGKAADYTLDGWHNKNISGFEKKFKALIGAPNWKRESLCNFEVYKYDEKYKLQLTLGEKSFFTTNEKFNSPEEARLAGKKIFEAAGSYYNYYIKNIPQDKTFAIHLLYENKREVVFGNVYATEDVAKEVAKNLSSMFAPDDRNGKIVVATYKYSASLRNYRGLSVRTQVATYNHEAGAKAAALKTFSKINDRTIWQQAGDENNIVEKLIYNSSSLEFAHFIDLARFKVDIDDTTLGKPGVITYELLDKDEHRFKFRTVNEFKSDREARDDIRQLLFRMTKIENYVVQLDKESGKWELVISENGKHCASSVFNSEKEAVQMKVVIHRIVQQYAYHLQIDPIPDTWRFDYYLGYQPGEVYIIQSVDTYSSNEEAIAALGEFSGGMITAEVKKEKGGLLVKPGKNANNGNAPKSRGFIAAEERDAEVLTDPVGRLVNLIKEMRKIEINKTSEDEFNRYVKIHEESLCPYVYQLVDKDGLYAFHQHSSSDRQSVEKLRREAIRVNQDEYNIPELSLKGDVTIERKGLCDATWYHYQLKTINKINKPDGGPADKLVLFESVKGYETKDEAEKAFAENYQEILQYGLTEENYGDGRVTSENKLLIQSSDPFVRMESIVYVPSDTLTFLGAYTEQGIRELVKVVKSYPIRSMRRKQDCEEYYNRFLPCEKKECSPIDDCQAEKEKPVYFFVLYNKLTNEEHWQCSTYYDTPEAAMRGFRFFLLLLRYEGNYFIDCDCTGLFKLFVREVLAESIDRFENHAAAWGKNGIQKFISASQQAQAFHAYTEKDCCSSFFIACRNIRIVHPHRYDTALIRDKVLLQLYHSLKGIEPWKFQSFCGRWNNKLIDFIGNDIATIEFRTQPSRFPTHYLDAYTEIIQAILCHGLCIDKEKVYLADSKSILFNPIAGSGVTPLELKEKLLWLACYFPFSTKKDPSKTGPYQSSNTYCIEIRFPDFKINSPCKTKAEESAQVDDNDACPIAWTSECCYQSCNDVIKAYHSMVESLKDFEHYRPIFDCPCGPYGIVFHEAAGACIYQQDETVPGAESRNHILAINPQCYPSAEAVCDAIERAKRLINPEGLHLMEHILLRPHDAAECDCRVMPCPNEIKTDCKFPNWDDADADDPCDERRPICFEPGQDPYSFIATVALPAWSMRFRKKENRQLLENILYREAPAHVMLRIVWLSPHDLCCFERHMKKWLAWMAYKTSCLGAYNNCEFIDFLFRREFECLDESIVCDTCEGDQNPDFSCIDRIKENEKQERVKNKQCSQTWVEQVTGLYCWEDFNCSDYTFRNCDGANNERLSISANEVVTTEIPSPVESSITHVDVAKKSRFVNGRLSKYRKQVEDIIKASDGNGLALKSRRFLDSNNPTPDEFNRIASDLLTALRAATRSKKSLTRKQISKLLEILVHFFMDITFFDGKGVAHLEPCRSTFDALRKVKINPNKIYQAWDPVAVKKSEPGLELNAIEKFFSS